MGQLHTFHIECVSNESGNLLLFIAVTINTACWSVSHSWSSTFSKSKSLSSWLVTRTSQQKQTKNYLWVVVSASSQSFTAVSVFFSTVTWKNHEVKCRIFLVCFLLSFLAVAAYSRDISSVDTHLRVTAALKITTNYVWLLLENSYVVLFVDNASSL